MKTNNKVISIYLLLAAGVCYLLGILEGIIKSGKFYQILAIGFTFIPVLSALITKHITDEKPKYHLSLRAWNDIKAWLLCALMPGLLIAVGTFLYYLIFPNQYSGIFRIGLRLGTDTAITVNHPLIFALVCVIFSALMIPIQLLELGEEIGWRGYVLGFQVEKYGECKAVIINGVEWGLAHLPLIWFGFNYSLENWGAPWSNMVMMVATCVVLGILLSYVTIKTGNCLYAAIIHGVVNVIGELPVYLSLNMKSGLLGPNPTGLITLLPLAVASVVIFIKMVKVEKKKV